MQAAHSRKESDDFSKLFFGNDSANLELGGDNSPVDPTLLEPSLSFQQPKTSFTSLRAFFSHGSTGIHAIRQSLLVNNGFMRIYVHTVTSILILLAAISIPVGLGYFVVHRDYVDRGELLVIDKSLESFEIPGHISSQRNDLVSVAQSLSKVQKELPQVRSKRSAKASDTAQTSEPAQHYQTRGRWSLELVYLAIGDDDLNIFSKERLETIHQIEQSLIKQPGFSDYCWKWSEARFDPFLKDGCVPPISLINFFYPSVTEEWRIYDGQGMTYDEDGRPRAQNLTDDGIKQTLQLLLTKAFTYWFVDNSFSKENLKSRFLRAELKFGYPQKLGGSYRTQKDRYKDYLVKYVEVMKKLSTNKVRLLYGGTDVFDYEVNKTLWSDIGLTIFTIAFVGAFVLIFTRFSLFLTFFGIVSILTPLCLAYFFFRYVFEVKSLGILSGISAFIIIGIGVDDVFVFINTFRQAHSARSLEARMSHTICTAGKATFFTSFTTAMAFAANCFSEMPAIRDFGLFMALIVGSCWLTVFFTIPPTLNLWHRYIAKWEAVVFQRLFGQINCILGSGGSDLPGDIVQFLSGNDRNYSQQRSPSTSSTSQVLELVTRTPAEDDDSLLVQLDSSPPNSQSPSPSSSDSDLAMFDDPNSTFSQEVPLMRNRVSQSRRAPPHQGHHNRDCQCRCGLQSFLYHWLAVPIQKYRYVVLVIFILILGTSIGLDSQIRPSTKPPSFFKESTNLQQLLSMKYNMSSESLDTKNIAQDLLVNEIHQSNNVDNPTAKPTKSTVKNSPMSTSTTSPKTPDISGEHHSSNVLQPKVTPPTNTKSTTEPKEKTPKHPTPHLRKTSTLKSPTKSAKKSTAHVTPKPNQPVTQKTPSQKPKTDHPLTKKTASSSQKPKKGDSGNEVPSPTALATPTLPPLCPGGCQPVQKPIVDSSATVYVILGLEKIDRSMITREHVIEKKGKVVPDFKFTHLLLRKQPDFIKFACLLCKAVSNNRELVREGGADCFPDWLLDNIQAEMSNRDRAWGFYKACSNISRPTFSTGSSQAKLWRMPFKNPYGNNTYWMRMAFESNIFMGKSSKEKVRDFEKWDSFLKETLHSGNYPEEFQTAFQTSSEWVLAFMEVIAVNSAIYGIVFSLLLCVGSVAVFTANALLTLIVMVTILGVLTAVVAVFYLLSWQLGAVEAISLSILVGTSVDYCVHLVEGYIMAGNSIPPLNSPKEIRGWRTLAAVSHIGTAILSSAITTVVASIPLCLTVIQLFAKFGQILAINTGVSIFFTLTICVALLCIMAPVTFRASIKSSVKALVMVVAVYGLGALSLYLVTLKIDIPGPSGEPIHW